jgi:hypothetical protein
MSFADTVYIQTQFLKEEIMTTQIVGNLELFSEAELESLEFIPEELESIESVLYPNLDSISLEEVAKDLSAYFEGNIEQAGLEKGGSSKGGGSTKGGHSSGKSPSNLATHQKGDKRRQQDQIINPLMKEWKNSGTKLSFKRWKEVNGKN